MARNLRKAKGRSQSHSFVMFPHHLLCHQKFYALSGNACKALLYLSSQFKGHNNGDLQIAWKIAKKKGWTSNGSLRGGVKELIEAGFVVTSRQGGRNCCSLYALTWFAIDDCGGKLDIPASNKAPNDWLLDDRMSEPAVVQSTPIADQSDGKRLQGGVN